MNISKLLKVAIATVFVTSMIGCASKGGNGMDGSTNEAEMTGQSGSESSITARSLGGEDLSAEEIAKLEAAGFKAANIIYFDYDSSQLNSEDQEIVEKHASYLMENPQVKIMLEGHADERGSREYNMALGEKRAYSVKQLLQLKGVSKDQIDTVSFGEEQPELDGHDESSWSKNRRAVFVYASN